MSCGISAGAPGAPGAAAWGGAAGAAGAAAGGFGAGRGAAGFAGARGVAGGVVGVVDGGGACAAAGPKLSPATANMAAPTAVTAILRAVGTGAANVRLFIGILTSGRLAATTWSCEYRPAPLSRRQM